MLSSSDENKEAQNGGDNQTWQEKLELLFGTDTFILEKIVVRNVQNSLF